MIDLCIYEGILTIDELNQIPPKTIIEITKNDTGDSGNQVYQRIEKFLYAKQHWYQHWDTINKYMFYTIEIENSRDHKASMISNKILKTLGINISKLIIPKQHYTNISESITPFISIEELIMTINSTKSTKGKCINNRIIENDSKICIHIDISMNNGNGNDANNSGHNIDNNYDIAMLMIIIIIITGTIIHVYAYIYL